MSIKVNENLFNFMESKQSVTWKLKWGLISQLQKEDITSLKRLCRDKGIPFEVFLKRMRGNLSIEDTLNCPLCRDLKKENILQEVSEYDGCQYQTVREIYVKYGLTKQTFYNRYNAGWEIKDLLQKPTQIRKGGIQDAGI